MRIDSVNWNWDQCSQKEYYFELYTCNFNKDTWYGLICQESRHVDSPCRGLSKLTDLQRFHRQTSGPFHRGSIEAFLKLQTTTEVRVFVQFHSNRTVAPDNRHWQQVTWIMAFWKDSRDRWYFYGSLPQHILNNHVTTCVFFSQLPGISTFFCCPRQELSIQDFYIGNPGRGMPHEQKGLSYESMNMLNIIEYNRLDEILLWNCGHLVLMISLDSLIFILILHMTN